MKLARKWDLILKGALLLNNVSYYDACSNITNIIMGDK